MVSIKTTLSDYFIPVLESEQDILNRIEMSKSGFITLTLPDESKINVNSATIIQFLEIKEEDLQPRTE